MPQSSKILFVTGRLAAPMLRATVGRVADSVGFEYSIAELPISVAALMTPDWIARHLQIPAETSRIIIPGYCRGDLTQIESMANCPVEIGPKDLFQLPAYFQQPVASPTLDRWDIEIIAEINHAPRMSWSEIESAAASLAGDGANVIDIGCELGYRWTEIGECVKRLRGRGLRVSVDSFESAEVADATRAGAELVLSVNRGNRSAAIDWNAEVVVVPDHPGDLTTLFETADWLKQQQVPFRVDPIIEPIGVGFAESLFRYADVRRRWPDVAMMMGVGNITELSEVDSAGVNFVLAAVCQELSIGSVLTTQVINWRDRAFGNSISPDGCWPMPTLIEHRQSTSIHDWSFSATSNRFAMRSQIFGRCRNRSKTGTTGFFFPIAACIWLAAVSTSPGLTHLNFSISS